MTDTTFASGTVVEAAWLNDVNNLRYSGSSPARGAALLPFYLNDSTATERTAQAKMREFAHIDDFSPVSGESDNFTALTRWVNSAIANPGVPHRLGNRVYATSDALPTIGVSGVKLYGSGPSSNHDGGAINCSVIKKIGGVGGTLLTISPTSGASNQRLDGIVVDGISFNGDQKSAKGLLVKSIRNSFFNVYFEEFTTSGLELDVVTSLVDARDVQDCTFRVFGRDLYSGGAILRLLGSISANVSLNRFEIVDIVHSDEIGVICQNPDNNIWDLVRIYRQPGGTATYCWEWQGGATAGEASRFEVVNKLTCTVAAVARGTGTYTVAANNILIKTLDTENGSPVPVLETGASVAGPQFSWTSTVSASSGTITSTSVVAFYRLDPNDPKVVTIRIAITMTNNGTGAGTLRATLPFTAANDAVPAVLFGYEAATGRGIRGIVNVNTNTLEMVFVSDLTYPGTTSNIVIVTGTYRRV